MATQFDPIAKDESLNTTESPSRNVADVLAQGLDAIEQAIAGGSGSGGHTIVNASGTDMTQRAKMQFVDAEVTDDAVNDVTKISTTPASYPSANVTYGSGSVEDALDDSKIFYKDIPIAGVQISNYYASVATGVVTSQYEAIGMTEGPVNITEVTVSVYRGSDNQYRLMLRSTIAATTLSSATSPIRVLFVKKSQVNPTPLP